MKARGGFSCQRGVSHGWNLRPLKKWRPCRQLVLVMVVIVMNWLIGPKGPHAAQAGVRLDFTASVKALGGTAGGYWRPRGPVSLAAPKIAPISSPMPYRHP